MAITVAPATILSQRAHVVPGQLLVTEYFFSVPLDHSYPSGPTIQLFARAVAKHDRPIDPLTPSELASLQARTPWMLYLEGGPGFGNREPQDLPLTRYCLGRGYQVLFLDYRGVGMSTPVSADSLEARGLVRPEDQAAFLRLFRQDSIVLDCEAVRKALMPDAPPAPAALSHRKAAASRATPPSDASPSSATPSPPLPPSSAPPSSAPPPPSSPSELKRRWTLLGQSFGGFVSLTYLSRFPGSIREVFLSGGLAPVCAGWDGGLGAETVYAATYRRVSQRNAAYFAKFPEDAATLRRLRSFLAGQKGGKATPRAVALPGGGWLTMERFLGAGLGFGSHGGLDGVHALVLRVRSDLDQLGFLGRATLSAVEQAVPFDANPIYALLHEAIYCDGPGSASNWAALRVGRGIDEFAWLADTESDLSGSDDPSADDSSPAASSGPSSPGPSSSTTSSSSSPAASSERPLYFSGEMIYPLHFSTYPELMRLRGAAEALARYESWPPLYDGAQLARNPVPVYAASFVDDMYVDADLARQTARAVANVAVFETNAMYHNAIRARSDEVLRELFRLRDDPID